MAPRPSYQARKASRERARLRPQMIALAAFSAGSCAFLAFAIVAAVTHPPLDGSPDGFASALAMLGLMAVVAGGLAVLAAWEARP